MYLLFFLRGSCTCSNEKDTHIKLKKLEQLKLKKHHSGSKEKLKELNDTNPKHSFGDKFCLKNSMDHIFITLENEQKAKWRAL